MRKETHHFLQQCDSSGGRGDPEQASKPSGLIPTGIIHLQKPVSLAGNWCDGDGESGQQHLRSSPREAWSRERIDYARTGY